MARKKKQFKDRRRKDGSIVITARDRLAGEIRMAHAAVESGLRDALSQAKRAGDLLLKAKEEIAHGSFMPWVEEKCCFSHATANLYMRIAREWRRVAANSERITSLSLTAIDEWLRDESKQVTSQEESPTGRAAEWVKAFDALETRVATFLQMGSREEKHLWVTSDMNRPEADRLLYELEALRRRVEAVIEVVKERIRKFVEEERLDVLAGMHDRDQLSENNGVTPEPEVDSISLTVASA